MMLITTDKKKTSFSIRTWLSYNKMVFREVVSNENEKNKSKNE